MFALLVAIAFLSVEPGNCPKQAARLISVTASASW